MDALDLGGELVELDELVRLTPQFVGNHRRLGPDRGHDGCAHAFALHSFDQRAEVAVAGEQNHVIDPVDHFHHVHRQFDVHVALHLAAAGAVGEFFSRFGNQRVTVVIEPIDQWSDR